MASSRTRLRIPLRTFLLKEMLARASYYKHVSLGPQDLDRSLGRHVRPYTETRQPIRPKHPAVQGGENVRRLGSTITSIPRSLQIRVSTKSSISQPIFILFYNIYFEVHNKLMLYPYVHTPHYLACKWPCKTFVGYSTDT